MGKQGPCYHCGVTSTPLWRNGPPEKPVLCNACGSRWRTKGTLTNYTPLHARADFIDYVDYKAPRVKTIAITTKEPKLPKRKHYDAIVKVEGEAPHTDQNSWKFVEEATSNRSSSGSAISYSESCIYFGGVEGCELTGSAQSTVWESLVPSRKRTGVSRPKPSSVEKLTKDLYCILHEQQQSSYLSGSSEEDLLLESGTPMDSFEMGHGGVLIKHLTEARDEESEASSFPVGNKTKIVSEAYSDSTSLPVTNGRKAMNFSIVGTGKVKKLLGQGAQEITRRDKTSHEKLHVLRSSTSPLRFIDLRDVASFEQFTRHMTHEEQLQLMKYLPSTDTAKLPDSLKSMFDSDQFLEAISFFQQMLLEGVFDLSFLGIKTEECRILKKLALVNLTKSKWVEHSQQLKYCKQKKATAGKGDTEQSFLGCGILTPVKRSRDGETLNLAESKVTMKNPRREQKSGTLHLPSIKLSQQNSTDGSVKECYDTGEMDSEGSSFSPRSLFAFPPDRSSCMLDSLPFMQESSEQDLLFDVPSNACFPQAELMNYNLPRPKLLQSNSQSGLSNQGESIGSRPSSSLLTEQ